ncbi:hypothetical protein [Mycolicibacterium alvei]|jgi:hypothetical protein|nr:hypothetical protein [Mycolicibacterium alvei]MCV7001273.1 hypothetical protein [Mycolicibacterium alvei]
MLNARAAAVLDAGADPQLVDVPVTGAAGIVNPRFHLATTSTMGAS